jgi:hypothetical protein
VERSLHPSDETQDEKGERTDNATTTKNGKEKRRERKEDTSSSEEARREKGETRATELSESIGRCQWEIGRLVGNNI